MAAAHGVSSHAGVEPPIGEIQQGGIGRGAPSSPRSQGGWDHRPRPRTGREVDHEADVIVQGVRASWYVSHTYYAAEAAASGRGVVPGYAGVHRVKGRCRPHQPGPAFVRPRAARAGVQLFVGLLRRCHDPGRCQL